MLLASLALAMLLPSVPAVAARDSAPMPARACAALAATAGDAARAADLVAALVAHGGAVRWATGGRPVRVWIQGRPVDGASLSHGGGEWRAALVTAVTVWSDVVPGLRVAIARDSATADVRVRWVAALPAAAVGDLTAGMRAGNEADGTDALAAYTAGRTRLVPDATGQAVSADIVVAVATPGGSAYLPRDVHAVAQHEMGHALGLAHHRSPRSVMSPLVAVDRIGGDDRAVLRALYALPVGAPCTPF